MSRIKFYILIKPTQLGSLAFLNLSLYYEEAQLSTVVCILQRDENADWIFLEQASLFSKPLQIIFWNKVKDRPHANTEHTFLASTLEIWGKHRNKIAPYISPVSLYAGQSWFESVFDGNDLQTWISHCRL